LFEEFDASISDGIPLPEDTDYSYSSLEMEYQSNSRKPFFFRLTPSFGQFFNGTIYTITSEFTLRLQPKLLFSIQARYDHIELPQPYSNNDLWLIGPRVDITFSKSIFWATFIQYSSQQVNLGINSRIQWRFAPLSDLFLVYNDNYFADGVFAPRLRSINLKLTYWLYL
jgi:hypothetical protein